jgi:hypothetical protein
VLVCRYVPLTPGIQFVKNVFTTIAAHKEKIVVWGIGFSAFQIVDHGFDYLLYPFVVWKLGVLRGGIVMTALSLLYCYLVIGL